MSDDAGKEQESWTDGDETCRSKLAGLIVGAALGDSIGLPFEGLRPGRIDRMIGDAVIRQRFLLGKGMVSDDTEHTCMVAQALLRYPTDTKAFGSSLAWKLRLWLLGVPAGIGWATLRSIIKLWLGFSPDRSGVFSAGNGPAMRSAIIGACLQNNPDLAREFVHVSTRLTHTDPKAETGAALIASAARSAMKSCRRNIDPLKVMADLLIQSEGSDFHTPLQRAKWLLEEQSDLPEMVVAMGFERGVSGYIVETVPAAIYCWLRWVENPRKAIEAAVRLGGDTDTTASIVGSLAGATVGINQLPREWMDQLIEWPRSISWMTKLAERLSRRFCDEPPGKAVASLPLFWPAILPRNALFAVIVLTHGFRRLLPPYGN